jgi:hypothetical protein
MPGVFHAMHSASSFWCQLSAIPESVTVDPETFTLMLESSIEFLLKAFSMFFCSIVLLDSDLIIMLLVTPLTA